MLFSVQIKNKGMINMAVYVWLKCIKKMVVFNSMQEYHESESYETDMRNEYNTQLHDVMVERNTKLWKE